MKKVKKIKPVKKVKILKPEKKSLLSKSGQAKVYVKRTKMEIMKEENIPVVKPIRQLAEKSSAKFDAKDFSAEKFFKAKIKVIGIGGGGGSIVSDIGKSLDKATFVVADTDTRALKRKAGIRYFGFGQELTRGLGTGVNVELAKQAAESAKEKMGEFFKEQDIIIFVASLGGGLGSGATQVFAETANNFGGITFGIFTLPFKFEGTNKQKIAQNSLKVLRKLMNVSLVIPNERIFRVINENTPITEAFSNVNKSLTDSLESLIDLIYSPGIINIDFADLRAILTGKGNSAFLNTIEESGKERAEKTCERILANPLLQNNNFIAEKILFNIAGGQNLSMFEVEKISRHISEKNPKAKIIFGISKDQKLKNKIKTTVLITGGGGQEVPEKVLVKIEDKKVLEKKEIVKILNKKSHKKPKKVVKKHNGKKDTGAKVPDEREAKKVSFVPVFETPMPVFGDRGLQVIESIELLEKKSLRRSGLEIKQAEVQEEKRKQAQEKEWEIPAFLRRVKYKS